MEGLIQPFLQNVKCSVVSANIKADQTLAANFSGYYQPYTIITVGEEKVAVVGYTTAETPFLSMPGKSTICCWLVKLSFFLFATLLQAAIHMYSEFKLQYRPCI